MFASKDRANSHDNVANANILRPAAPFYAIGDLHGRIDLLDAVLAKIDPGEDQQIVLLGDYIDRGPHSAQTLDRLYRLSQQRPDQVVCLMGNHEKMLCDFIDDPLGKGAIWLHNGGLSTLSSFGITGVSLTPDTDQVLEVCEVLIDKIPNNILKWMRNLPKSWNSGNVWCVHAAMNPMQPPQVQRTTTLLWGHSDFLGTPRQDGLCVVHGHTIVSAPMNNNSRIAIDTGAFRSGRLTAAHISHGQCEFITT